MFVKKLESEIIDYELNDKQRNELQKFILWCNELVVRNQSVQLALNILPQFNKGDS
jgi:hypothetical protein